MVYDLSIYAFFGKQTKNWYILLTAQFSSIILGGKTFRMALFFLTSQIIPGTLARESWIEGWIKFDFGNTATISKNSRWLSFIAYILNYSQAFFCFFVVSIAEIMTRGCTKLCTSYIIFNVCSYKIYFLIYAFFVYWIIYLIL